MTENAKFIGKKLFETTTGSQYESESVQSMWAYSVKHREKSRSGRFRISIQKVSAAEMIEALGGSVSDSESKIVGYSISGFLEKWDPNRGWMHVLDWMGNPSSSYSAIESDLYEMYKSFVTATPAELSPADIFPDFDPIPPFDNPKANNYKFKNKPVKPLIPKSDGDSDSDFDWI